MVFTAFIVRDLHPAGHHQRAGTSNIYTTTVSAGDSVSGDSAALHGEGSRAGKIIHTHAASSGISRVVGDGTALHGEGTTRVHIHTAAFGCSVAGDGAILHEEGTTASICFHIYAASGTIGCIVAADGAALHGEAGAGSHMHTSSAFVAATGGISADLAAVHRKRAGGRQTYPTAIATGGITADFAAVHRKFTTLRHRHAAS